MTISVMVAVEIAMPETLTPTPGTQAYAHEHDDDPVMGAYFCRECFRVFRGSESHAKLKLIGLLLKTTESIAEHFLDRHPEGCGCVGCHANSLADAMAHDVETIRRMSHMFFSSLAADIDIERGPDGDTFGDDLRELAKLADEADRLFDLENSDEEGSPAVVVAAR